MKIPLSLLVAFCLVAPPCLEQVEAEEPDVPILVSASLPTYPRIWWFAQIQGKVVVRIVIKKGTVVETEIESGDDRLKDPTIANLKTWRFGDGINKAITITYTYEISGEPTEDLANPRVEIQPDLSVKLTARPGKPHY